MPENFWGELPTGEGVRTPVSLLVEQASLLEQMTKGLLLGKVSRSSGGGNIGAMLNILAPGLNNYTFAVVSISHAIAIYPVAITDHVLGTAYSAQNEEQLTAVLKQILGSGRIKQVIAGLLAQVRANTTS